MLWVSQRLTEFELPRWRFKSFSRSCLPVDWLTDWLTDCMSVGWLTVVTESVAWISRCAACWLQTDRQTDRQTHWLTVTDCDWLWLTEWLVECVQTTAWHVDFHLRCDGVEKRRLSSSVLAWSWHCIRLLWVSKWVNCWLSDWVTEWLTKWVNDWLVD